MGRKFKPIEDDKTKIGWHHFSMPFDSDLVIHGFANGNFSDSFTRVFRNDPVWQRTGMVYHGLASHQKVSRIAAPGAYQTGLVFHCERQENASQI